MVPKPYDSGDKLSFAYDTVHKRLPSILRQVITDLGTAAASADADAKTESKEIAQGISKILDDLANNAEIKPFPEDTDVDRFYNEDLAQISPVHYQSAPWLYFECEVYRRAQLLFSHSKYWKNYDMFGYAKDSTFEKSADAVSDLAKRYISLGNQIRAIQEKPLAEQLELLEALFHEALMTSLWGNATDLSLLVTVDLEEIKKLQVATAERDKESIISNDFAPVWKQLRSSMGGRVDIVLDNAGFELYTDVILALFLIETGLAEQIVIHPKSSPWFVSDVTPRDWITTTTLLGNEKLFPKERSSIDQVVEKLLHYQSEGQIIMRPSEFWTLGCPFWDITKNGKYGGNKVWEDLRASKLVIFKGDLNYRKLTGDRHWERTTSFTEAIQGLATNGIPIVSLRTVKSDVCVGLAEGKEQQLEEAWGKDHSPPQSWCWSGKFAVVSYSSGK